MKIRYVTSARMPTTRANGLQIMKTCEALASRGVEVELMIPGKNRRTDDLRDADIFDFYKVKRNFRITPVWVPPAGIFGRKDIFVQDLFFSFVAGMRSIFASEGTIMYSRQPRIVILPLICGRRAVFESHEGRWSLSVRLAVLFGLRIITITRASMNKYLSLGMKEERLAVSPDATDLSLFSNLPTKEECRKIYGIGREDKVAMYTGSFTSYGWKGLDVFLAASNEVKQPIKFFAVGGGCR